MEVAGGEAGGAGDGRVAGGGGSVDARLAPPEPYAPPPPPKTAEPESQEADGESFWSKVKRGLTGGT